MAISIVGQPSSGDGPSRFWSTVIQLGLAGAFSELFQLITEDVGGRGEVYLMAIGTLAVVWAMAFADEHGIPYPGQKKLGRVTDE